MKVLNADIPLSPMMIRRSTGIWHHQAIHLSGHSNQVHNQYSACALQESQTADVYNLYQCVNAAQNRSAISLEEQV